MSSALQSRSLEAGARDLIDGLYSWRSWTVMAFMEVRRRYRRSTLGQLWLTLSMAVTIAGIGITFGLIMGQPLTNYVPFLGVGLIIWTFMSSLINELASAFIGGETYVQSYPGPRSFVIYSTIAKNVITFAHNLLLVPVLLLFFWIPVDWSTLLFIPGIILIMLNAIWIGILLGPLCTRFRDLLSVVTSIIQLMFFITPIMFKTEALQERLWLLTALNPFTYFLAITREPLLGSAPELKNYLVVLAITIVGFGVALPFYARFRSRIIYWL